MEAPGNFVESFLLGIGVTIQMPLSTQLSQWPSSPFGKALPCSPGWSGRASDHFVSPSLVPVSYGRVAGEAGRARGRANAGRLGLWD